MLLAGIVFLVLSIGGTLLMASVADDPDDTLYGVVFGIFLLFGILMTVAGATKDQPQKKSLKDYSYRIEIKLEVINGVETSRDTVYIFTPKKKSR